MKKWITLGLALVLFTGVCSAESEMNKLEVEGPVKNLIVWREVGGQVNGEKKCMNFPVKAHSKRCKSGLTQFLWKIPPMITEKDRQKFPV